MSRRNNQGRKPRSQQPRARRGIMPVTLMQAVGSVVRVPRSQQNLVVTMRYSGLRTITGVTSAHVSAMNGLYDPDVTGVGGQPVGFDQWMSLYSRYTVIHSSIVCQVSHTQAANPAMVTLIPDRSTTPPTDAMDARSNRLAVSSIMTGTNARSVVSLRRGIRVADFVGRDISSINYSGSSTANPASVTYWVCLVSAMDLTTSVTSYLNFTVEYQVLLSDPLVLDRS